MSGCLKLLFSRAQDRVETVVLNTSGGLTSGDRLSLTGRAERGATLSLTTQAAERAYRADQGHAEVATSLTAADDASLLWLPQELILFNGARLSRKLTVSLAPKARALIVEPVIFGRHAMGERLTDIAFRDEIKITRNGAPLLRDVIDLTDDVDAQMARSVIGCSMGALATIVYVAPDAEAQLTHAREGLPTTGGASLLLDDVLVVRVIAEDSLALRRFLIPLLDHLSQDRLPVCWRL